MNTMDENIKLFQEASSMRQKIRAKIHNAATNKLVAEKVDPSLRKGGGSDNVVRLQGSQKKDD